MDNGVSSYRRFQNGDQDAFVEIVDMYRENLMLFLYRFVCDMNTAEDLAEDVFVEILLHPKRFHFQCSLKTWLFTIGRNKAVSHIRKQSKITYLHPADAGQLMEEGSRPHESLEEVVLQSEEKQALSRAMDRLTDDYRAALHLVYFEEMTYEEAGRIMKKSRKQIENLVYRGKQSLRKMLKEEGIGIEEQR